MIQRIEGQTHRFDWKNGKLHHTVDEELRAIVDPANLATYRETFPGAPTSEHAADASAHTVKAK